MRILIIHGIGGHAGIHWQQWLHSKLFADGHTVMMPNLSNSDHPNRTTWLKEISAVVGNNPTSDLVIVGHSLGVPIALDYIESLASPIRCLVSVSGFASAYGAELNDYFMKERTIDFGKVRANLKKAVLFYGDDDPYVPQQELRQLADDLQVEPVVIEHGGHLNADAGFTEFPALFDAIVSL